MKVLQGFDDPSTRHGYVAIGNFDGVHRGHQSMFETLCARAREAGVPAVVVTFDPHPVAVLRPAAAPQPLMTLADRLEHIAQCGPDATIVQSTTPQFLELSARAFFDQIVRGRLGARGVVEGENFRFGRGRDGTVQQLAAWCQAEGLECEIIPPVLVEGRSVSSSGIRRLIGEGEVAAAADLLGRPHRVRGQVVHGEARGAKLGFPTANLAGVPTLLPAEGVYAGWAHTATGRWGAAINLGPNPTFGVSERKFEVHLLDFQGDLYGQPLEIEFLARLRGTLRFSGIEALLTQIRADVAATRDLTTGR
jgi:riboflavin kinase/FMN adenylyltransferase